MAYLSNIIPKILKWEGGFVNDPDDLGGATNMGVTIKTYRHFFGAHKTVEDLKKLTIKDWSKIARKGFWEKVGGDNITSQDVAELLFDFAWGSGVNRANKLVQNLLNKSFGKHLVVDGITGPKTQAAINSVNPNKLFNKIWDYRYDYLHYIVEKRPQNAKFLNGWLNRLNDFQKKKMAWGIGSVLLTGATIFTAVKIINNSNNEYN